MTWSLYPWLCGVSCDSGMLIVFVGVVPEAWLPLVDCEVKVKAALFCGVRCILLPALWDIRSDDDWDPVVRTFVSFTSATTALTWKQILSELLVFSVKLTLNLNTFSKSLVISFGMKPCGFSAISVSAAFFVKRWTHLPNMIKFVSPISSPAIMLSLYLWQWQIMWGSIIVEDNVERIKLVKGTNMILPLDWFANIIAGAVGALV